MQSQCPKCGLVKKHKKEKWDSDKHIYVFRCSCGAQWVEYQLVYWDIPKKEERQ